MDNYENLVDIIKSIEKLRCSAYDIDKFILSLKYQLSQLEYFYCELAHGKDISKTFYKPKLEVSEHKLAYFNIGRGFPKELMDGHWCYIVKKYGYKALVIPCTSIKEKSRKPNGKYELDIDIEMNGHLTKSRLQITDMRTVDLQRLDVRKNPCIVLTQKKEIEKFIFQNIAM